MRVRLCVAVLSLCLGCSTATHTGRDFDPAAIVSLPEGTSREFVRERFGEPQATTVGEDGTETWTYSYTAADGTTKTAKVRFRSGRVVR